MFNYAIGDLQGCFKELLALLKKCQFDPKQDRLWLVGDLINRGPESLDVLHFLKALPIKPVIVLGNHDLHFLSVVNDVRDIKKQDTFQDILKSPDCNELYEWLRQQPLLYHDKALGFTMVHAGLVPQWDLEKAAALAKEVEAKLKGPDPGELFKHLYSNKPDQWSDSLEGWDRLRFITNCLTRIRYCDKKGRVDFSLSGKVGSQPANLMPWFKVPGRASASMNIIFGHWAALMPDVLENEKNIFHLDTGCVWGNSLTALRLEDKQRIAVSCERHADLQD
jgi:bis(5'-nucleosyl)-tetraphosphatase (symmetrical)